MTAQASESLLYQGEQYAMFSFPLCAYFALVGKAPDFEFETGLGRGYVGSWMIENDRLCLIKLSGYLNNGREINLRTVFPDSPFAVFADWYSGNLVCPSGRVLKRRLFHWDDYEEYLVFEVCKGMVVRAEVHRNEREYGNGQQA